MVFRIIFDFLDCEMLWVVECGWEGRTVFSAFMPVAALPNQNFLFSIFIILRLFFSTSGPEAY